MDNISLFVLKVANFSGICQNEMSKYWTINRVSSLCHCFKNQAMLLIWGIYILLTDVFIGIWKSNDIYISILILRPTTFDEIRNVKLRKSFSRLDFLRCALEKQEGGRPIKKFNTSHLRSPTTEIQYSIPMSIQMQTPMSIHIQIQSPISMSMPILI